ncbi:hypothetical protein AGR1A_pAt20307 [Agrobacterium fabacearum CFBP 5771]|nr:hypothetical protein AGR1A_pAt20307 [Agrobacterium fabacearum CFBP 5771]
MRAKRIKSQFLQFVNAYARGQSQIGFKYLSQKGSFLNELFSRRPSDVVWMSPTPHCWRVIKQKTGKNLCYSPTKIPS